jgi:hypothetical protein
MAMSFRVLGLAPELFEDYFSMTNAELAQRDAIRVVADDPRMP